MGGSRIPHGPAAGPILALWVALLSGLPALAAGAFLVRESERSAIVQPTETAVIRFDGTSETMIVQAGYDGPPEETVWLIPAPSKPEVKKFEATIFAKMARATREPDVARNLAPPGPTLGPPAGLASLRNWLRRIGDYNVALFSPEAEEGALEWLKANGHEVPPQVERVLREYIDRKWWIVAARIDGDALKAHARNGRGSATIHPLEIRFATETCIYPIRLASLSARPAEVLLYVEADHHVEPANPGALGWSVDFLGPADARIVGDDNWRSAYAVAAGKGHAAKGRLITKLQCRIPGGVPAADLELKKVDYSRRAGSPDPLRRAAIATQYGRQQMSEAVPWLVETASSLIAKVQPMSEPTTDTGALNDATLLATSIWALGQIGAKDSRDARIEATLLRCAESPLPPIRREAWIGLAKCGSAALGPMLLGEVRSSLEPAKVPVDPDSREAHLYKMKETWKPMLDAEHANLPTATEWLDTYSTGARREEYAALVLNVLERADEIGRIPDTSRRPSFRQNERLASEVSQWIEARGSWAIHRAGALRDPRFVPAIHRIRQKILAAWSRPERGPAPHLDLADRALAAYGIDDTDKDSLLVNQIIEAEAELLADARNEGGFAVVGDWLGRSKQRALRTRIRLGEGIDKKRRPPFEATIPGFEPKHQLKTMSLDERNGVIRRALAHDNLNDFYRMYLLSWIVNPGPPEIDRLIALRDAKTASPEERIARQLVAAEVLFRWERTEELRRMFDKSQDAEVRRGLLCILAQMNVPRLADAIEQAVRSDWKANFERTRLVVSGSSWRSQDQGWRTLDWKAKDEARSYMTYLHAPEGETALKRLCSDTTLSPHLRYMLLTDQVRQMPWKKPLLEDVAREIISQKPSTEQMQAITRQLGLARMTDLLLELWSDDLPTTRMAELLDALAATRDKKALPTIQKAVGGILPRRFATERGKTIFGKGPRPFGYFCAYVDASPELSESMKEWLRDESLDPEYKVFLIRLLDEYIWSQFMDEIRGVAGEEISEDARRRIERQLQRIEKHPWPPRPPPAPIR